MMEMFDVIAVDMETRKVRMMDENKTAENAEAIKMMAVARRGVDVEFFATVPHGAYKAGDAWPRPKSGINPRS